ncbi:MAG: cell division ATP-binding protein FtsE [Nitrospirae bacterium]|nr:MAG: cell division ATP-binding protein FtsE [Nitrospirota bacterium]
MIVFDRVTKDFGHGRPVLKEVSFHIAPGEMAFLIGRSGAGKTTLLRLVYGAERPDSGTIRVAGRDVSRLRRGSVPYLRRNIGIIFQDSRLLPSRTVAGNVLFALQVAGIGGRAARARVAELLERVGMAGREEAWPAELSGGEKQRVAIARALANDPALLLADEATGNLDPDVSEEILALFDQINRSGTTVLFATHDMDAVREMRRRVLTLVEGEMVSDRPPELEAVYG